MIDPCPGLDSDHATAFVGAFTKRASNWVVWPLLSVTTLGVRVIEIAGTLPTREMVWTDGDALSLIVTAPLKTPEADAPKLILIVQLAPAFRIAEQVFVSAKLLALTPVSDTPAILRVPLPVFVSVTVWVGLVVPSGTDPNVMEGAESDTAGEPVEDDTLLMPEPHPNKHVITSDITTA